MGKILDRLKEKLGESLLASHEFRGDETVVVGREALLEVTRFLKTDSGLDFNILMDLTAVDYLTWGEARPRFEVVYHLYSLSKNHRVRIKVPVEEKDPVVPSLTTIWPAADWYEREVWDMFGIRFPGHPNLKRILMYEEFAGHPLRKDYPVTKRQPLIGPKN
ncbi:MAG: NADH-quinone oxidoreductase subunit C [Candidatus Omnitrophica bacterium]|nr:NADH-quinone oxidoreductase subunit C [Candidatus Omnitrophota bacterium]